MSKNSEFKWVFRQTIEYKGAFKRTTMKLMEIFKDGMGQGEWDEEEIRRQLKSSNILGFLEDKETEAYGYFIATVPEEKFNGKQLLWIDACSVREKYQQYGYFTKGIEEILNIYKEYDFGYIGGRSQNPIIFRIFDKLSSNDFYPFGKCYTAEIIDYLKRVIENEIKRPSEEESQGLNVKNGIIKNAFWHKKLGTYKIDFANNEILKYEKLLLEWGFDRFNGDAVVLFKDLKQSP